MDISEYEITLLRGYLTILISTFSCWTDMISVVSKQSYQDVVVVTTIQEKGFSNLIFQAATTS